MANEVLLSGGMAIYDFNSHRFGETINGLLMSALEGLSAETQIPPGDIRIISHSHTMGHPDPEPYL
jgi:hypothetical protein